MSIFSLKWFKNQNKETLELLKLEEQIIKNQLLTKQLNKEDVESKNEKPYLNIKLVNNTLTIVLKDGNILSKQNATEEDFNKARIATEESELFTILENQEYKEEYLKKEKEAEKVKVIQKGISILTKLEDFVVEDNTVYLKGINRSLPQLLVEKFIEVVNEQEYYTGFGDLNKDLVKNEEYLGLKNFFMWCCLNPRAEVADKLYEFLQKNSFRITKQGFFVALRNVVTMHGSNELVQFISNVYNKVKAVWKKNPNDYTVFIQESVYKLVHKDQLFKTVKYTSTECPECEGSGLEYYDDALDCENCNGTGAVEEYQYSVKEHVNHGEKIGTLTDLYLDLPNRAENRFTDDWTKTFDIRIGRVVNMPMEECNWSTQDCAASGLHFCSDSINYVGCGDTSVLVLINPMKIVGIGELKGRCYEYLPIMTVPREEATAILHDGDFDTLQLDEQYAISELENIAEKVKEGFAVEAKKHDFNMPNINTVEINNIVASLEDIKKHLNKRVVNID